MFFTIIASPTASMLRRISENVKMQGASLDTTPHAHDVAHDLSKLKSTEKSVFFYCGHFELFSIDHTLVPVKGEQICLNFSNLVSVNDKGKRHFYQQLCVLH